MTLHTNEAVVSMVQRYEAHIAELEAAIAEQAAALAELRAVVEDHERRIVALESILGITPAEHTEHTSQEA